MTKESKSPQIPQLPEAPRLTRNGSPQEETFALAGTPQLTRSQNLIEVLQPGLALQSEVTQQMAPFSENLARQYRNNSLRQNRVSLDLLNAASLKNLIKEADEEDKEDANRVKRLRKSSAPIEEEKQSNANPEITRAQATNLQEMNLQQRERG